MKSLNLYIHIPFCKSKCPYCGFFSCTNSEKLINEYFNRLKEEISYYSNIYRDTVIDSIYIGGGTPNFVDSKYIVDMLRILKSEYMFSSKIEISIELIPEYITEHDLSDYVRSGINRVSIGLQSAQNSHLKSLGRRYTYEEFLQKYELVKKVGIKNIGIDLIFGYPEHTMKNWVDTLLRVTQLDVQHISSYSLEVEKGTVYGDMDEKGKLFLPHEQEDRDMYHYAIKYLGEKNLPMYEISNFAKPGFECKHNLNFWHYENYLGFGAGAHSRIDGYRWSNVSNIEKYIKGELAKKEMIENIELEKNILGLRLWEGILYDDEKYDSEYMEKHQGRMRLNSKGRDFFNLVAQNFL